MNSNIFVMMGLAEKLGVPVSAMATLVKYKDIKPEAVSLPMLSGIATDLGFLNPDEQGLGKVLAKLHADNPPDIISWLSNDANIGELVSSLRGDESPFFHQCPYCKMVSAVKT